MTSQNLFEMIQKSLLWCFKSVLTLQGNICDPCASTTDVALGRDMMRLWQLHNKIMADTPTCIGQSIIATMMDTYILFGKEGPSFGCA